MPRWSLLQDECLREHANEGAERCAAIIRHRFGVSHTPDAVKRHAYRIGVPIIVYEICPSCGGRVRNLGNTGVCYACRQRELAAEQRRFNESLLAELLEAESPAARRRAEREYDAARAQTARIRRKHRERGVPDGD